MTNNDKLRAGLPCALACVALLGSAAAGAAGTPDPGDYVPAPAGTSVLALYAQQQTADATYTDGEKTGDGLGLTLNVGVARFMHYFEVAGRPMDVEVILPYARQSITSLDDRVSGLGNLQIGSTLWTLSDVESGRHWGWAAYLSLPTGQDKANGLLVSEDRYALDVETGYILPLGGAWSLDLIGQTEFYTRDDTSGVSRRPLLRAFAHLSYQWSPATRLAVSARQSWGASESLDGETTLGTKNDTNLMLTWAHQFTDTFQLQLQYAQDVKVRNGNPVRALQARTVFAF
ncbi:MAG: transporter [Comamonas sp.]